MLRASSPASSSGCPWTARTSSPSANISTGAVAEASSTSRRSAGTRRSRRAPAARRRAQLGRRSSFRSAPFFSAPSGSAAAGGRRRSIGECIGQHRLPSRHEGKPHVLGSTVPPSASAMTWHRNAAPYTLAAVPRRFREWIASKRRSTGARVVVPRGVVRPGDHQALVRVDLAQIRQLAAPAPVVLPGLSPARAERARKRRWRARPMTASSQSRTASFAGAGPAEDHILAGSTRERRVAARRRRCAHLARTRALPRRATRVFVLIGPRERKTEANTPSRTIRPRDLTVYGEGRLSSGRTSVARTAIFARVGEARGSRDRRVRGVASPARRRGRGGRGALRAAQGEPASPITGDRPVFGGSAFGAAPLPRLRVVLAKPGRIKPNALLQPHHFEELGITRPGDRG